MVLHGLNVQSNFKIYRKDALIPGIYSIDFDGHILSRGFWLYVWEIAAPTGTFYYIGRTGDSSSHNAQSPFNRMSQHLGSNVKSNVLRRHLESRNINPEECSFSMNAFGPIQSETETLEQHRSARDSVSALEKALADSMRSARYNVINEVNCRKALDMQLFSNVLAAFSEHYPRLCHRNE